MIHGVPLKDWALIALIVAAVLFLPARVYVGLGCLGIVALVLLLVLL